MEAIASISFDLVCRVLDGLNIAVCYFDKDDRTVGWNDTFLRFFPEHAGHVYVGEPYADNLRRFYDVRLGPDELPYRQQYIESGIERHRNQTQPFSFEHRGAWVRVASLPGPDGGRIRIWTGTSGIDVTELTKTFEINGTLQRSLELSVFESVGDGIAICDSEDRIVAVNSVFARIYGLFEAANMVGTRYFDLVERLWAGQPGDGAERARIMRDSARFQGAPFEMPLPGGRFVRVIEQRKADGTMTSVHADITAMKVQQQKLEAAHAELMAKNRELDRLVITDVLTGLANRRKLEAEFEREVRRVQRHGNALSVILFDIDYFKKVNDTLGHLAGDEFLQEFAQLIAQSVRAIDLVGRWGGEEFLIICVDTQLDGAMHLAEKLREKIAAHPFAKVGAMTASFGVATLGKDESGDHLIGRADDALYRAKRHGRNQVVSA